MNNINRDIHQRKAEKLPILRHFAEKNRKLPRSLMQENKKKPDIAPINLMPVALFSYGQVQEKKNRATSAHPKVDSKEEIGIAQKMKMNQLLVELNKEHRKLKRVLTYQ